MNEIEFSRRAARVVPRIADWNERQAFADAAERAHSDGTLLDGMPANYRRWIEDGQPPARLRRKETP